MALSTHLSPSVAHTVAQRRGPGTGHGIGGFSPKPCLRNSVQKSWHEFKFAKNSPCPGHGEKKKRKRHLLPVCQPSEDSAHHDGYLRTSGGSADSLALASEALVTSRSRRRPGWVTRATPSSLASGQDIQPSVENGMQEAFSGLQTIKRKLGAGKSGLRTSRHCGRLAAAVA